jgi:NTP pyrophosphatase (non-canonical NTP hydrolase)
MNDKTKEALMILQEECAEVTQAVSKIFRFGMDSRYPEGAPTTKSNLEMELGDLLCMINILVEQGVINDASMLEAMERKRKKLETWSNIFNAD